MPPEALQSLVFRLIQSLITGRFGRQSHEDDNKEQHCSHIYRQEPETVGIIDFAIGKEVQACFRSDGFRPMFHGTVSPSLGVPHRRALETLRFQGSSHIHRARRHRFARFLQGVLLVAIAFGVQCLAVFVQIGVVQVGVCLHRLRERMVSGYPLH